MGGIQVPLFLAKDVAEWIDYSKNSQGKYNVNSMLSTVDEEEKLVLKVLIPGDTQKRNATLLTEDGLYEVLMQSRKPIAKQIFGGIKMNNLIVQNINGRLYVDSREVAEMIGKDHDKLLRDIRKYKETLDNNNLEHSPTLASPNFFVPASYKNSQNRDMPCYLLTRKGCDMVANKMTGEKGALSCFYFYKIIQKIIFFAKICETFSQLEYIYLEETNIFSMFVFSPLNIKLFD